MPPTERQSPRLAVLKFKSIEEWQCPQCQATNPSKLVICQNCRTYCDKNVPGRKILMIERVPGQGLRISLQRRALWWIGGTIEILLWMLPTAVLIAGLSHLADRANEQRNTRLSCTNNPSSITSVTGVIRQAGPHFFMNNGNSWREITHACTGKNGHSCLKNNPGIAALKANIGKNVTIDLCNDEIVWYTVEGQKYVR